MFSITPARPDAWPAAFDLALQYAPADERPTRVANALALLAAGDLHPEGLLAACDARGLIGMQVVVPLAGASGLFWLPQVKPGIEGDAVADALVQAGLAWLHQRGDKLAHAILEPALLCGAAPLLRNGFVHVTRLHYFRHDLLDLSRVPLQPALRLEPYRAHQPKVFHQTLLRTYEGSRDCPELNQRRTIEEIIAGHRAQGHFHPERWQLAWLDDEPAGVVIATEMFDNLGWDLSYVGVVPQRRRRGVGRALTGWALEAAKQAHAEQMILAVDARNEPALAMYEQLGFQRTEDREVLLRFLD